MNGFFAAPIIVDAPSVSLNLAALPSNVTLGPVEPTAEFVEDVRYRGVVEPIILKEVKQTKKAYKVITGRRRIKASRIVGYKTIPARIFPHDWDDDAILTLILHDRRRENPLTDLEAIENLLSRGYSEQAVCAETGIARVKLTRILHLRNLIPEMREALNTGKLKPSVAVLVARLPKLLQLRLLSVLLETGRIKVKDIKEVQQTERSKATADLPFEIFDVGAIGWKEVALLKIGELKKLFLDNKVEKTSCQKLLELEGLLKKTKKS